MHHVLRDSLVVEWQSSMHWSVGWTPATGDMVIFRSLKSSFIRGWKKWWYGAWAPRTENFCSFFKRLERNHNFPTFLLIKIWSASCNNSYIKYLKSLRAFMEIVIIRHVSVLQPLPYLKIFFLSKTKIYTAQIPSSWNSNDYLVCNNYPENHKYLELEHKSTFILYILRS